MGNIVWMASYPKSGNTWVRAFLHNYLSDGDKPSDINSLGEFFANESNVSWYRPLVQGSLESLSRADICRLRPQVHSRIAASRRGTIMVKTHNFLGAYEGLPLQTMELTAGAVVVVRNPLDVVISLADHFGLSIDEAISFMAEDVTGTPTDENNVASVLTSWSTHVDSWTRDDSGSTHVLRYEDLLDKPTKHFTRLLKFLGLQPDPTRLKRAIEHSSFDKLRSLEARDGFIERSPSSRQFFRRGRKNQWRDVLSESQFARIASDHMEIMQRFGYLPKGFKRPN